MQNYLVFERADVSGDAGDTGYTALVEPGKISGLSALAGAVVPWGPGAGPRRMSSARRLLVTTVGF